MKRAAISASVLCLVLAVWGENAKSDYVEKPIADRDRDHWFWRPLSRPPLPEVKHPEGVRNPIDRFVLKRLEQEGLGFQPQADRRTLIRRLTFDLTGLPPTSQEIDAFLHDSSDRAYEKLVDRLLASTAYGEHVAQAWLDLARFAETDGFEHDKIRPNAWRYRDWVIDAFNQDMPYDRFVQWQIAGDILAPDNLEAPVATGFLLAGQDMPDINLNEERRHTVLNEMTATVGAALMGLSFQCAQCHDHKNDPISQADFYRLRAFFESGLSFDEQVVDSEERIEVWRAAKSKRDRERKQKENELRQAEKEGADSARIKKMKRDVEQIRKRSLPPVNSGRVMNEEGKRVISHLMIRGDFRRAGMEVQPAFPRIANPAKWAPDLKDSGRARAELAVWLTRDDHALVTRTMANRIWQLHFGRPLAPQPNDMGRAGGPPSHPELLDWLALELPRRGWSLKAMHRLILTSSTYRQASRSRAGQTDQSGWSKTLRKDPANLLYSRMPRRRLTGEVLRDSMLQISGRLNRKRKGPGVRPPLPKEITGTLLRNQWEVSSDPSDHVRRSIYLFARRNLRFPMFDLFDRPSGIESCAQRQEATTAPQALTLLNDGFTMDCARALVKRCVVREPQSRIGFYYQQLLGRNPVASEMTLALEFIQSHPAADFCITLFNVNEFLYID